MRHRTTRKFRRALESLNPDVQEQARRAFELLKSDPYHPSLHFKRLRPGVWSARVGAHYRVLAEQEGDEYTWTWIGPHSDYDLWFGGI